MKAKFDAIRLRIAAYRNLTGYQERLLFNRVQAGMPLSPAGELLATLHGRTWPTGLIELVST